METGDNQCICAQGQSQSLGAAGNDGHVRNEAANLHGDADTGVEGSLATAMQDLIIRTRQEGDFWESARGIGSIHQERDNVDLNDYKPVQTFPFNERPLNISTLNHELAKNIVGIQFERRVAIYKLERVVSVTQLIASVGILLLLNSIQIEFH